MKRILVAYFSAGGVTAGVACELAAAVKADLFEIVPMQPYTAADLDWRNKKSRSTLEMQDRACRPALAALPEDLADYDVAFVGFPIWWYREPSIIDTFMEACDFKGKVIVPFATSGGSGLGDTAANLRALAPGADVRQGRVFSSGITADELARWAAPLTE